MLKRNSRFNFTESLKPLVEEGIAHQHTSLLLRWDKIYYSQQKQNCHCHQIIFRKQLYYYVTLSDGFLLIIISHLVSVHLRQKVTPEEAPPIPLTIWFVPNAKMSTPTAGTGVKAKNSNGGGCKSGTANYSKVELIDLMTMIRDRASNSSEE